VIDGIGMRGRAGEIGADVLGALSEAGRWIAFQVRSVVDLPRWHTAASLQERAEAVSWPRAAVFTGLFAAVVLAILAACGVFRHKPGPGPLPTERELRIRAEAVSKFKPTPPAGLGAANKSVPQTRSEGSSR
jgi:hypothetical protein